MIGWYKDDVKVRRSRPWGSDVAGTIQVLEDALKEDAPPVEESEVAEQSNGLVPHDDAPVKVTDATFEKDIIEASHQLPVLVDFWAEWCGPCRQVAPMLEKLAKEFAGQVRIAKVNVDENPVLSQTFRIQSIPNFMMFKQGKLIFNQPGAFPEAAFRDLIQQAIDIEIPADPAEQPAQ